RAVTCARGEPGAVSVGCQSGGSPETAKADLKPPAPSRPPILFRLPLHSGRFRVLELEPVSQVADRVRCRTFIALRGVVGGMWLRRCNAQFHCCALNSVSNLHRVDVAAAGLTKLRGG